MLGAQYETFGPSQTASKRRLIKLALAFVGLTVAVLLLIVAAVKIEERNRQKIHQQEELNRQKIHQQQVEKFYSEKIVPLVDASRQRDIDAANRAIQLLHARFQAHHDGVAPFAKEVAGWGAKAAVVGLTISEFWEKYARGNQNVHLVKDNIEWRFRQHVLSEDGLKKDIQSVLSQFKSDLVANRNQLLSEVKLALRTSDCPVHFNDRQADEFLNNIGAQSSELIASMPQESIASGVTRLLLSTAGTYIAEQVTTEIIAGVASDMSTDLAIGAVADGGATVGGAAAGGGGGSLAGPAGTAAGLVVGLGVGLAIDWWLSDKLEADLTGKCNAFLDDLEHDIAVGHPKSPGLRGVFSRAVEIEQETQRQVLHKSLADAEAQL